MAEKCNKHFSQVCLGGYSHTSTLAHRPVLICRPGICRDPELVYRPYRDPKVLYLLIYLDALSPLMMAIQSPNAKEDLPAIHATENAISAVAKICRYIESGVPYDSVLPLWLSWLPVVEDKEEACHVYTYLCDLIERLEEKEL